MNITGELVNFNEFTAKVNRAIAAVSDLSPVFLTIANDWYKDNHRVIPEGGEKQREGQYEDLSDAYAEYKESTLGWTYPILRFDGWLAASITVPGSDGSLCVIGKQSLTLGTLIPYAIYHQSSAPRHKMPYRPFIFNKRVTGTYRNIYEQRYKRNLRSLETFVKNQVAKAKRS